MRRIRNGFRYLCEGTLLPHLKTEWLRITREKRCRQWQSQKGKREYLEKRIQPGIKLKLWFDDKLCEFIYCYEEFLEHKERAFINRFLQRGDVFVDVGAHIGWYTLIAARRVGKSGRVYAFEPSEKSCNRLRENISNNHLENTSCFRLALSDGNTHLPIKIPQDGYDAWTSFGHPSELKIIKNVKNIRNETVETIRWDDFSARHNLTGEVSMMKIDVEGWETRVLAGGSKTFCREDAPVLLIEFADVIRKSCDSSSGELYQALEKLGYKMFVYEPLKKKLVHDPLRESYPHLNLIAIKNLDRASAKLKLCGISCSTQ